ncbi:MAG: Ig-like domain-containing protein [Chloroflexota bacterium]
MKHSRPSADFGYLGRLTLFIALALLVLFSLAGAWHGQSLAAPTADCNDDNFSGTYETEDVTLSGDLYVAGDVLVRNDVTVTLEAGSNVTMCGAHHIRVEGGGNLRAIGTEAAPITFDADDPAVPWDAIQFLGEANHSVLRHVILNDGGGDDPAASKGSVEFINLAANPRPSPTLDHVTVNNSGAYGLYLQVDSGDASPPSISNVTIDNSAVAAVLANAQALGGFGGGNTYTNNAPDTIQVIAGGASRLDRSQIWRNQGVPFEMLGTATVAAPSGNDPFPTLTVEAGTTFLMHPDARLDIGTSSGRGASLLAEGTAEAPITFTRLDGASAPWDKLRLSLYPEAEVRLQHVALSFGGSGGPAMIEQLGDGQLTLDHVTASQSQSAGLHARGAVSIDNSTFEFNETGLEFWFTAGAVVRNSIIRNNVTAGLLSLDSGADFNRACVDAIGNYWGSPDGPADSHDQADACGNPRTNNGAGDGVSGGVLYEPWLPGDDPLLDRGTIRPAEFYVIADGADSTQVAITLRDAQGNPLVGKQVQLNATVGTVVQPTQPTDADGMTTAVISSTTVGFTYLSAYNLTDDAPLSGLGGVTFWQGAGDGGGLISPGGAPFASPQLILNGQPFQSGFPVGMSVPMQNSNPYPLDVQVIYGVSGLGLGARFAPVYTATTTLQPGESWDAQGVWLPPTTGHRCIQATIIPGHEPAASFQPLSDNTTTKQKNTNQNPCDPANLDIGNALPSLPRGGLVTVGVTFYKLYNLSKNANKCLTEGLDPSALSSVGVENERDYEQVVTPPTFTPPPIAASGDLTAEQADALNDLAQTSADLLSLNLAMGATAQRLNWAAQATSIAGASTASPQTGALRANNDLFYLDLQYEAYRDFANQYAGKLDLFADQIDALLGTVDGVNDAYYLAEDFQATRDELSATGFTAEEIDFYRQTGLSDELIGETEKNLVDSFDRQASESISFGAAMADIQASSRALAERLRAQNPAPTAISSLNPQSSTVHVPPQVFTFDVGHPFDGQETVELVVRPVTLPVGWTYQLSQQSVTVGEDQTSEVALTLTPGDDLLEGDLVQVTVEGYVNDELVGGTLMEYLTPRLTPTPLYELFLPAVER